MRGSMSPPRCSALLWFVRCEALLIQRRDADGRVVRPHVIDWQCTRCHRVLGSTQLQPRWSLLTNLRRQVVAALRRAAMRAIETEERPGAVNAGP